MNSSSEWKNEYDDELVARLELIWGEGFLPPGGANEVRALLEGVNVRGMDVLDIGCGTGGIDVLLIQEHGATRVVGVDVEKPLIQRATKRAQERGMANSLKFRLVDPGRFPFDAASFHLVFSKDAILHIPDKPALFADIFRVLKSGGRFIASDWLRSSGASTGALDKFLAILGLTTNMETQETSAHLLEAAGFVDVQLRDRTKWLANETRMEDKRLSGSLRTQAMELMGKEKYDQWMHIRRCRLEALEAGELRACHLLGQRPPVG